MGGSPKKPLFSHFSLYRVIESTILKGYLKNDRQGTCRSLPGQGHRKVSRVVTLSPEHTRVDRMA